MKWLLLLSLMLLPTIVFGQDPAGLVTCSGPDCNLCSFVKMVKEIVNWLFTVLASVAVLALVFAGFKLVTSGGNQSAMESAKSMLTNIIIGFVIVLSAWLIVDTLLKAFLSNDIQREFGPWNKINTDCGGLNLR